MATYIDGIRVEVIGTIFGGLPYLRVGDAGTTNHSLASEDDLMVTGKLEIDGATFFDGEISSATTWNPAGAISFQSSTYVNAFNNNAGTLIFQGKDIDGSALVQVAKITAANDPYWSMGGSQEHKFYNSGIAELGAEVGFGAAAELTISTGAVAVTKVYHSITVEGDTGAADDDLSTATGGTEGQILILRAHTTASDTVDQVTVKDGTGSDTFICAGGADFTMDHVDDRIWFIHNGTEWVEISRSSNS